MCVSESQRVEEKEESQRVGERERGDSQVSGPISSTGRGGAGLGPQAECSWR